MIRVLIVDDQELVRLGFRMLLEAEPDLEVVGEAGDGASAVALAARTRPAVVLMDVRMPGLDGIAATRRIVERDPQIRVIVLTTYDLDEYAFGGLRAGASGFLLKDVGRAELLAAIRSVAGGDAAIAARATRRMLDLFARRLPEPDASDPTAVLTPREREVFAAIAAGMNNAEIAHALHLTESTVKTHVGRVLLKLEMRDRVQLVIFAYERGLI